MRRFLVGLGITLALVLGVAMYQGYQKYSDAVAQNALLQLSLSHAVVLNDSTTARLTSTTAAKDSLEAAFAAAEKVHGTVVAALRLKVARRDTTVVHDTLVVDSLATDSTRYATFTDSTFAGTITGEVVAPPCCAPLQLQYTIERPAFSPTIAFIRIKDSLIATVTWAGEDVSLSAPYAQFVAPPKRLGYWADIRYDLLQNQATGEGGALLRLGRGWQLYQGVSTTRKLFVGTRKEF